MGLYYKDSDNEDAFVRMIMYIIVAVVVVVASIGCGRIDTSGQQIASGEVVVRYVIDLKTTAEGLFDICDKAFATYTGTDKEDLQQECAIKQVEQINTLLDQLFQQVRNNPTSANIDPSVIPVDSN